MVKSMLSMLLILILGMSILSSAFAEVTVNPSPGMWEPGDPPTTEGDWTNEGNYDISWYTADTTVTQFTISDAADLAGLAYLVKNKKDTFKGDTITLSADVDLSGKTWTPIGTNQATFNGTFNGNNKKISGLTVSVGVNRGLFHTTGSNAIVKDLTLTNVYIGMSGTSQYMAGAITGSNQGKITNCIVESGTISCETTATQNVFVGGIAGQNTSGAIIESCVNNANVGGRGNAFGGIIGKNANGIVKDCTNYGNVTSTSIKTSTDPHNAAGGIAGVSNVLNNADAILSDCVNYGCVSGTTKCQGGIVGEAAGKVENCTNNGAVIATGTTTSRNVGGIGGYCWKATISNCINNASASITGGNSYDAVGGIAGCFTTSNLSGDTAQYSIRNCINYAAVNGAASQVAYSANFIGGIVGKVQCVTLIDQCANVGDIQNYAYSSSYYSDDVCATGGLVGSGYLANSSRTLTINNSYNVGTVSSIADSAKSKAYTAGLVGAVTKGSLTLTKVYNTGVISAHADSNDAIVRYVSTTPTATNCFYWEECGAKSSRGTALSAIDMTHDANWSANMSLDTDVWEKSAGTDTNGEKPFKYLPVLKNPKQNPAPMLPVDEISVSITITGSDDTTFTYGEEMSVVASAVDLNDTDVTSQGTWSWQTENDTYLSVSSANQNSTGLVFNTYSYVAANKTQTLTATFTANDGKLYSATIDIVMAPCEVTVSGIKAQDKEYDGNRTATLDFGNVTFGGKPDDGVTLSLSESNLSSIKGNFDTPYVGSDKSVTITGISAFSTNPTSAKTRYTLVATATSSASITSATQNVTVTDAEDITVGKTLDLFTVLTGVHTNANVQFVLDQSDTTGSSITNHVFTAGTTPGTVTVHYAISDVDIGGTSDPEYTHNPKEGTITITVAEKKKPVASANDITVTYGETIEITGNATYDDVSVPGTWSFVGNIPVNVSDSGAKTVRFEPEDTDNYAAVEDTIVVTINKATPTITTYPSADAIIYGQPLNSSTLSGGEASIAGSFTWNDGGNIYPAVADSNTTEYAITFVPTDTGNYNAVPLKLKVVINPLKITPVIDPVAQQTYTGIQLTPALAVKADQTTELVMNTDYVVEYGENINCIEESIVEGSVTIKPVEGSKYTFDDTTVYFDIAPASQTTPASVTGSYAPNADKTAFVYTISAPVGTDYQYSKDGTTWEDNPIFDGFNAGDTATFYARVKADPNHKASNPSQPTRVTFEKLDQAAPVLSYQVSGNSGNRTITIAEVEGAEYSFDGGNTWGSSNVLTGINDETVNIAIRMMETAVYKASEKDSDSVNTAKQVQNVTFDTTNRTATYGDGALEAREASAEGAITYESSDETVATVDDKGIVTIVGVGTATITAKAAETETHAAAQASYSLTVNPKALTAEGITLTLTECLYQYDGTAKTPVVLLKDGNTDLEADKDYQVKDGSTTTASAIAVYTITLTGKGNYTGDISEEWEITKIAAPAAPQNLQGVAPTTGLVDDGKIIGTTDEMEYATKADFSDTKDCGEGETTNLAPGTYYVRLKGTDTTEPGAAAVVNVPAYSAPVITFDANGGTIAIVSVTTEQDGTLAELPTATRNGHEFNGWFTAKTGGTQVTVDTFFSVSTTIYAQWTYILVPPVIDSPAADTIVEVYEGQTAQMTVVSQNATSYQWFINRNDGVGFVEYDGSTLATHTTAVVKPENDGFRYYCLVTNADGSVRSHVFTLKVLEQIDLPQTGDNSQIGLWAAMCLLSMAGILLLRKKPCSR